MTLTITTPPRRKKDDRKAAAAVDRFAADPKSSLVDELRHSVRRARAPRLRTMREFAEQEIVIPTGPFAGRRFRCAVQPFNRLWFDQVGSGRWSRHWATGPSQATKSFTCFIVPMLYHLFEIQEAVICGLPDMDMAGDKWERDLVPVIEASRYRDLMPVRGGGSRGGKVELITFRNGVPLKFMSGGGRDKSRAHYSARVLVITEADALDESGLGSVEADKITQLRARLRSWGDRAVEYGECTLTTEEGRTYREIAAGTQSRIVLPCPHCRVYVIPEREHVQGWQDAADELEAVAKSHFCCPDCGKPWSEGERVAANQACRLVHRGQSIDRAGRVRGDPPRTRTLGFRWSAAHNLFRTSASFGADLWRAQHDRDEENAEKELCQFVFAVPYQPPILEAAPLSRDGLVRRTARWPKGFICDWAEFVTVGVDLGKRLGHWAVLAARADGACHLADYGCFEVRSDELGVERATLVALREFRDVVLVGWARSEGGPRVPDQVWIDSGWAEQTDTVYGFCREPESARTMTPNRRRFWPTKGYGAGQDRHRFYHRPKKTGPVVVKIGEGYHISRLQAKRTYLVEVDADFWKSWVHERLTLELPPEGDPAAPVAGVMTFYQGAATNEHRTLAHHLTAEKQVEEFVAGKGTVRRWALVRRNNHWLDAIYNAAAAAHFCGVRVVKESVPEPGTPEPPAAPSRLTMPDGRPYLITERGD